MSRNSNLLYTAHTPLLHLHLQPHSLSLTGIWPGRLTKFWGLDAMAGGTSIWLTGRGTGLRTALGSLAVILLTTAFFLSFTVLTRVPSVGCQGSAVREGVLLHPGLVRLHPLLHLHAQDAGVPCEPLWTAPLLKAVCPSTGASTFLRLVRPGCSRRHSVGDAIPDSAAVHLCPFPRSRWLRETQLMNSALLVYQLVI